MFRPQPLSDIRDLSTDFTSYSLRNTSGWINRVLSYKNATDLVQLV